MTEIIERNYNFDDSEEQQHYPYDKDGLQLDLSFLHPEIAYARHRNSHHLFSLFFLIMSSLPHTHILTH